MHKLQKELEETNNVEDFAIPQQLLHLNGIINETLRLHPAVRTGGLRETPPGGAFICGRFVPGNIVVCAPRYTLSRRKCIRMQMNLSSKQALIHSQSNLASRAQPISSPNAGIAGRKW